MSLEPKASTMAGMSPPTASAASLPRTRTDGQAGDKLRLLQGADVDLPWLDDSAADLERRAYAVSPASSRTALL